MTKIKVCGLMNKKDIDLCIKTGVDILGFVVEYPLPVPWNLTTPQAEKLIAAVPASVNTSIVVGGSVERIIRIVDDTHPDIVQLHYKETLKEIEALAQVLSRRDIKVVKALCLDSEGRCNFEISDPILAVKELSKTGISAILIDSYTTSRPGGTGVQVDVTTFRNIQQECSLPLILAGGLNPENITTIVKNLHPYAVDVLTGVENEPNNKDINKLNEFVKGCRVI
ncbi:MAG: phosphoribosylanthranilate isomerase [Halanaerobiales bacterium]